MYITANINVSLILMSPANLTTSMPDTSFHYCLRHINVIIMSNILTAKLNIVLLPHSYGNTTVKREALPFVLIKQDFFLLLLFSRYYMLFRISKVIVHLKIACFTPCLSSPCKEDMPNFLSHYISFHHMVLGSKAMSL